MVCYSNFNVIKYVIETNTLNKNDYKVILVCKMIACIIVLVFDYLIIYIIHIICILICYNMFKNMHRQYV